MSYTVVIAKAQFHIMCNECGAAVENNEIHDQFHADISKLVNLTQRIADSVLAHLDRCNARGE